MIRISITGPESTGKSWLAENLAQHYTACWVPEYSREYLEKIGTHYTYNDVLQIAKGQYVREQKAAKNCNLLFCDTDFLVTSIWCQVKYGKCHPWITQKLNENLYELYLLCDIDLPWQYDPLREHPEMRKELFYIYQNELERLHFNYAIITGSGQQRLQNAIKPVDTLLAQKML